VVFCQCGGYPIPTGRQTRIALAAVGRDPAAAALNGGIAADAPASGLQIARQMLADQCSIVRV
jgi:hypothetical protein